MLVIMFVNIMYIINIIRIQKLFIGSAIVIRWTLNDPLSIFFLLSGDKDIDPSGPGVIGIGTRLGQYFGGCTNCKFRHFKRFFLSFAKKKCRDNKKNYHSKVYPLNNITDPMSGLMN